MRCNLVVKTEPGDVTYFVDAGHVKVFLSCTNAAAHSRPSKVVRCCWRKLVSGCSCSRAYPTSRWAAFKPNSAKQKMHQKVDSMVNMCSQMCLFLFRRCSEAVCAYDFLSCHLLSKIWLSKYRQKGLLGARLQRGVSDQRLAH